MKKHSLVIPLFLCLFLAAPSVCAQTMSDQQVLEYVKQGMAEGKDQRQLATELARRGVTREQAERVKKLYEQQQGVNASQMSGTELNEARLREAVKEDTSTALETPQPDAAELAREDQVFGRNIFNTRNLTFEPSVNLATPPNYRLGPGDEVIIDIWGTSQNTIRQQISPDGTINIEKIGPVSLSGMTVSAANDYLKKVLGKTYSGLDSAEGNLEIRLTLGNTRTIQINVMGEVMQPGTYALSSFSTVFHALYRAGGVNEIGSLRSVQVVRSGQKIADVDVYDFIMKGKIQDDIRLQEGDVIIVPAYEVMVRFSGNVKRPMRFEMKARESLAILIQYAGGFDAEAYTKSLRVVRQNGEEYEINTVRDKDFSAYQMRNGDVVTAEAILNRFTNKLEIRGAVYRPGIYQLSGELNTVRALITEARGLTGDAFMKRAVLQRERPDLTTEIVSVDVAGILNGTSPDIPLQKNDILNIPSIHDLEDRGDVMIYGEVARPDSYSFSDNMTLEDLIIRAGGLREAASTVRVDVSRRIKDPRSTSYTDSIGQNFTFALKDGFVIDGQQGFVLQPYDQVFVRRSPGYQAQQNVQVTGEVLFGGTYAMTSREERLSDLLRKAGGATPRATFSVGLDLEKALANPGGEYDLVLREGDVISVPKMNNTVKIDGAVMVPNTVAYLKGKNVSYYLDQAGGYADNAKKSRKFIIYMNGQVTQVGSRDSDKIEPGCEIIVPSKKDRKVNVGEILGYASSFGSLATMFATITNLIKK